MFERRGQFADAMPPRLMMSVAVTVRSPRPANATPEIAKKTAAPPSFNDVGAGDMAPSRTRLFSWKFRDLLGWLAACSGSATSEGVPAMNRHIMGAAVALALLPASAVPAPLIYATVTGTIDNLNAPHDDIGFFAVPGSSLAGEAFSLRLIFDVAEKDFTFANGTTSQFTWSNGGVGITASMTINGRSIAFDGTGFLGGGSILVSNNEPGIGDSSGMTLQGSYSSPQIGVSLSFEVRSLIDDFTSSADPAAPFSYATGANTQFFFSPFEIREQPGDVTVFAALHIDTIAVSDTGDPITAPFITEAPRLTNDPDPVDMPEPATLAIIGLGLAGLTLARRRRSST